MKGDRGNSSSPFFIESMAYNWLQVALDIGITETEFWDMTFAEVERAVRSYERKKERSQREKASFDYILADLIGKSVARVYNSANVMPTLSATYPTLFSQEDETEALQKKKDEMSAIRFKQFADSFNARFKEVDKSK